MTIFPHNFRCNELLARMKMVYMQSNIEEDNNSLEILEFNAIVTTIYKMIAAVPAKGFGEDR